MYNNAGKIGVSNVATYGWEAALRGMRNPMNSHSRADSVFGFSNCFSICDALDAMTERYLSAARRTTDEDFRTEVYNWLSTNCRTDLTERITSAVGPYSICIIGPHDMDLILRLQSAGSPHNKFMRQIGVSMDISMPRYWWSEMDTYKVGTVADSQSSMHKLLNSKEPISLQQFYFTKEDEAYFTSVVEVLEAMRQESQSMSNMQEKNVLLARAKRILPEAFIQTRTWTANYQVLLEIVKQRENHRLRTEWYDSFCAPLCKMLPYFDTFRHAASYRE